MDINLDEYYSISLADASDDVAKVQALVKGCIEESPFGNLAEEGESSDDHVIPFMNGLNPNTVLVLLKHGGEPVGFLAGIKAASHPFVPTKPIAMETAWWVHPDHRNSGFSSKMLDAYEMWAKWAGCSYATMANMQNDYSEKLGKSFLKRGFRKIEESYIKEIV